MQSRTGVPISSMHMRGLGTSGVSGYVLVSREAVATSHTQITRLLKSHQRQCIEKYENLIFDQLNKATDTDFKLFWKLLGKQGGNFDSDVAVGFFEHYNRGFGSNLPEDELSPNYEQELSQYTRLPNTVFNKFLSDPLELKELEVALGSLPRKKSPGHDCILNEHLIHAGAAINDLLLSLFNSVLKHTSVPEGW